MSEGTIRNGERLPVEFGSYSGEAGVNEWLGEKQAAFFADYRGLRRIETGKVDGKDVSVVAVDRSATVKGMVVVTFEPPPARPIVHQTKGA